MPNIEMIVVEGLPDEKKEELIVSLTQATQEAIAAPVDSIRVWLKEIPAKNFGVAGKSVAASHVGATPWGTPMSVIQVFFIAGRTNEQKERLIAGLAATVSTTIGIAQKDVCVVLNDIPNTEYGIAGKTAKSLGRGVGRSGT